MDSNRGTKNQAKGVGRQIEGKKDEVVGAITGDTSQELGGKLNKNLGKAQEKLGRVQEDIERDDRS